MNTLTMHGWREFIQRQSRWDKIWYELLKQCKQCKELKKEPTAHVIVMLNVRQMTENHIVF